MSGQYPSGYNSPLGGHRGQFNPQQQQQSPQMINTMNQMGGGGMGQNAMVGGGAGAQIGVGSGGMMPMGGYHPQQQQQLQSGMSMSGPGNLMNTPMQMQQQQQQQQMQQHVQMVQGGGGGSGPVGVGMMGVGSVGQGIGVGATGNIMQHPQQQHIPTGMPMNVQQQQQQQQQGQMPHGNAAGMMHTQQPAPPTTSATGSNMLAISQPNPHKEINIVSLSRLGQETVQDITSRFQEIFTALKVIQPTGNRDNSTEKKVQEYFRTIRLLFKRVRIIYEKCNDGYPHGMDYTNVESLITYKEEQPDHRNEPSQCDEYRKALQENQELIETVRLKNRQLREVIDRTRIIIWEINTMLAMRRS
ncbi:mediator of RNA polymerase II transcription subunit 30 [Bactrocera dorsalis]|uniref:Mediator of RNA polymerase II transcription subunit 30 n=1 Tax=Bactrocera dorsalis TaxID=27457 RepID=A0A6J0RM64_BACDO|nr:mediator of RNA polymerase II transcription subunit 30 [Bactrocera dorsalis]